jgi:hypothetical protein
MKVSEYLLYQFRRMGLKMRNKGGRLRNVNTTDEPPAGWTWVYFLDRPPPKD